MNNLSNNPNLTNIDHIKIDDIKDEYELISLSRNLVKELPQLSEKIGIVSSALKAINHPEKIDNIKDERVKNRITQINNLVANSTTNKEYFVKQLQFDSYNTLLVVERPHKVKSDFIENISSDLDKIPIRNQEEANYTRARLQAILKKEDDDSLDMDESITIDPQAKKQIEEVLSDIEDFVKDPKDLVAPEDLKLFKNGINEFKEIVTQKVEAKIKELGDTKSVNDLIKLEEDRGQKRKMNEEFVSLQENINKRRRVDLDPDDAEIYNHQYNVANNEVEDDLMDTTEPEQPLEDYTGRTLVNVPTGNGYFVGHWLTPEQIERLNQGHTDF